ncbi:hypothetical protein [Plantibacter sp. 2H11-2]|uniref:hypothetical protein n=1 Tax=Plantibacter sp. 2H11-2 TaxID=3414431 RepID=UPI003CEE0AE7
MRTRIWLAPAMAAALALTGCTTQPSAEETAHRDLARAAARLQAGMTELTTLYDTADLAVSAVRAGETSFGSTLIGALDQVPRAQGGAIIYAVKSRSDRVEVTAILRGVAVTSDWTGQDTAQVYVCVAASQAMGSEELTVDEVRCPDGVAAVTAGGGPAEQASIDELSFERP